MTHIERMKKVVRRNGKNRATLSFQSRGRISVTFTDGPLSGTTKTMTVKAALTLTPSLNPKKILSEIIKRAS